MAHRTLKVYGHFEYELKIPERWPDSAIEEVMLMILNDDGDVIVAHPEQEPMIYRRRLKKYVYSRQGIDGYYYEIPVDTNST